MPAAAAEPVLPIIEPEDQDEPPGLDEDSEGEDTVDYGEDELDYGSDAGGIHDDKEHDHYVEAWWDSVQSWCSRINIDTKNFFHVAEVTSGVDPALVAPVDGAELEFDEWMVPWMECYHTDLGAVVTSGAALAARWDKEKITWAFFIEREIHNSRRKRGRSFTRKS